MNDSMTHSSPIDWHSSESTFIRIILTRLRIGGIFSVFFFSQLAHPATARYVIYFYSGVLIVRAIVCRMNERKIVCSSRASIVKLNKSREQLLVWGELKGKLHFREKSQYYVDSEVNCVRFQLYQPKDRHSIKMYYFDPDH